MRAFIFLFSLVFLLLNLKQINSLKLNKSKSSSNNCTLVSTLDNQGNSIFCLLQLQNGDLAAGAGDGSIIIWNVSNGTVVKTLAGHQDIVINMLFLKNGSLVSASYDGTIKIWDVASSSILNSLDAEDDGNDISSFPVERRQSGKRE